MNFMNPLRIIRLGLSPHTGGPLDPLSNADAAEGFFRSLPRGEPIISQQMLCDALTRIGGTRGPDVGQLRALVLLDRRAQSLLDRLMSDYLALGGQSLRHESQLRHALFELSRSFALGYDVFVRHVRDQNLVAAWLQYLPLMLVQFFKHREMELLLSLLRYEPWPRGRWSDLNAAFRFALANGLDNQPVVRERRDGKVTRTLTPQHAFIRILLLRLVDTSAFAPLELNVVRRWIAAWSMLTSLQHATEVALPRAGFLVDLSCADGLRRSSAVTSAKGETLHLDTTPVVAAIERELATTYNASADAGGSISNTRRIILLSKLKRMLALRPERVTRRGERTEATLMSVQAVVGGLPGIFRMLRHGSRRLAALQSSPSPYAADGTTITDDPSHARPDNPSALGPSVWQVRDRSESGYRLHGRISNPQHLTPGCLIALRDAEAGAWTLAVVRRLKRSVGNNFEVGVECIGCDPQCVVLGAHSADAGPPTAAQQHEKLIGLFLAENHSDPRTAIKTLVLPTVAYASGRELTMLSKTNETKIRLRDPIEQQSEFVWASLEILDTRARPHCRQ